MKMMNRSSIDSYAFNMTANWNRNTTVKHVSVEEINFGKG